MRRRPSPRHRWILVTGLSGAGKSTALKALEDEGYFSIDNLPLALLPPLLAMLKKSPRHFPKVVLGMDAREKSFLQNPVDVLHVLRDAGVTPEILFFECQAPVLIRRFSESRRPHPLGKGSSLAQSITEEQRSLAPLRELATKVFDTSELNIHDLKQALRSFLHGAGRRPKFEVHLLSFGFKNGIPAEADLVLDVRFFKNPYFVPSLKRLDGRSRPVQKFVLEQRAAQAFLRRVTGLLRFLLPQYQNEGKAQLTVAVGCTGGRHRSVSIVEALGKGLKDPRWALRKIHRDIAQG
ncbi:MAG: RNase adapter RapZ [bacterium]